MEFGSRLKELRQKNGLTQSALADIIGLKPTAISNYEANRNQPSFEVLVQLANHFEVSCDYLLGVSDKYLPVMGEVLDKDIVDFYDLYQKMDVESAKELKLYAEYQLYKQVNFRSKPE